MPGLLDDYLQKNYGLSGANTSPYAGSNMANMPQLFMPETQGRASMQQLDPQQLQQAALATGANPRQARQVHGFYNNVQNRGAYKDDMPSTLPHELSHMGQDLARENRTENRLMRYSLSDFLASLIDRKEQKSERYKTEKHLGRVGTRMGIGHRDTTTPYREVQADLVAADAMAPMGKRVWDQPDKQGYFETPGAKEHYLRYSNPLVPKMESMQDQGILGGLLNMYNDLTLDYPIR